MKKLISLLGLLVLTSSALTSCVPDENPISDEDNQIDLLSTQGTYLGSENKLGKYKIDFTTKDAEFEFNLISDAVADNDILDAQIKSTKYIVSDSGELYTTKVTMTQEGQATKISTGAFDITQTGNKFTIKGDFTDEHNKPYHVNYVSTLDIQPIYETVYEIQNGWYWGDDIYEYPNVGEYMTFFTQGEANRYGELEGDGYHISLSFFDEMAPKAWEAKVPNKTYKASSKIEVGTFHVGTKEAIENGEIDYSFATFLHNDSSQGIEKELFIIDGSIKVLDNEKGQEVRFNIELQDGSRHIGKYVGKVRQGDEYTISTLKSDKTVGKLDYGYMEYKGKSPIDGKENNRWDIYLYNENIIAYPEYYWATEGSGDFMRVTIYTTTDATTDIPAGAYPIGDETAGNAGLGGGTEAGLDWGTWFFEMKNDNFTNYAPTRTGTVTLAKVGDQYTVKVDAVDDRQNKIVANYTGALTYINNAKKPSAKPNAAKKAVKKTYGKGKIYDAAKASKK